VDAIAQPDKTHPAALAYRAFRTDCLTMRLA
jgi:hypothetical protein